MRKRRCTQCGDIKALAEFYVHRCAASGLHGACKVCHRADVNARRRRRLAEDSAGFRARTRAASRRYARTAKGRAAGAAAARRYRQTAKARARRAARKRLPADAEARRRVLDFYRLVRTAKSMACAFCGHLVKKPDRRVVHVVAVATGGSHTRGNLTVACARCWAGRARSTRRLASIDAGTRPPATGQDTPGHSETNT